MPPFAFMQPAFSRRTHVSSPPLFLASANKSPISRVHHFAESRGYYLENRSLGPLLNLQLNSESQQETVATISGALLPNRLHIETYKATARDPQGSLLSVSPAMLLFIAALANAAERNISNVYGLAIDDAPDQHTRLVRYLQRFGGKRVMRVTDDLSCVPARLFYGGFGTVIRGDVHYMLARGLEMLDRAS